MFVAEVGYRYARRWGSRKDLLELFLDLHEHTRLYGPKDKAPGSTPYLDSRQLFDYNEHFIEWGGPVQGRSFDFLVLTLLVFMLIFVGGTSLYGLFGEFEVGMFLFDAALLLFVLFSFGTYWYVYLRGIFLTAVTPRYRFNRTTRKVYVARPRRFGGNVVLDWDRVQAHPSWAGSGDLKAGFQHDPQLLAWRQERGGGHFGRRGLMLYWPPLDPEDPEHKGEDVLWVGQWFSGKDEWEYIRCFMEKGIGAVHEPEPGNFRRKGRSSMWQHLVEEQLDPELRHARLMGNPDPHSAVKPMDWLLPMPFLIFNTLAQWLCYWPTFPREWNSDCGQKRRERGIGMEEPIRWVAK